MRIATFVLAAVALTLALAQPTPAQVRSTIVGPGVTRYPIAVAPLKQITGGASERFTQVLTKDLELSGLFRVLPRDAYIENAQTAGVSAEAINFENWSVIGALALVKGTAERQGNDLTIEARLFDVGQRRQLAGRRFRGVVGDEIRMANRFADEVIATFTGQRGPFDSQIAFLSTRGGRFKDVYVMAADGEDVRRVTNENTLNLSPSWAPDGRSLVLTSFRGGNPDLYAIGLGRGTWSRLSALRGLNLGGRWSPDGRQIAVTLEFDGNPEIAILNPDGSLARRLTDHWAVDVSASWSPDGTQLVFCSDRSGSPQIYVMGADGGDVRRVSSVGRYNTSPSWAPKGDRIAYATRIDGRFQIVTVKSDGSDARQVTSVGSNEDPTWSPDGRYLVFSSKRGGAAKLYLSDLSGANQAELTTGGGGDTSPSWSGWLE
ncbi:MAG TPA: Tol-Pal system beta propeller repeat protein TolB [Candidatus Dormibacteraeota bacterium]|nr:Tol-Pal system beta propeller repeat protein TolB [Candidatus Dormibacteraeota bacterium]